jgi:hypothetical protein
LIFVIVTEADGLSGSKLIATAGAHEHAPLRVPEKFRSARLIANGI